MKEIPITAIIILYHSKHLLPSILVNLIEKITGLKEILLIDNSNQDLSGFESHIVKIIHPPKNIGYGSAINLGMTYAQNENVIILNPDVELQHFENKYLDSPEKLYLLTGINTVKHRTLKFPTLTHDFCKYSFFYLSGIFSPFRKLFYNERTARPSTSPVDWIVGCLIVTNKATLTALGGFDEIFFLFYEETDLCKRAHKQNVPVSVTTEITYSSRHGQSSNTDVSTIKFSSEMASLLRYHSKYSSHSSLYLFKVSLIVWTWTISKICSIIFQITHITKVKRKAIQYAAYLKELQVFKISSLQ